MKKSVKSTRKNTGTGTKMPPDSTNNEQSRDPWDLALEHLDTIIAVCKLLSETNACGTVSRGRLADAYALRARYNGNERSTELITAIGAL